MALSVLKEHLTKTKYSKASETFYSNYFFIIMFGVYSKLNKTIIMNTCFVEVTKTFENLFLVLKCCSEEHEYINYRRSWLKELPFSE